MRRGSPPDHILLSGSPGLGKTTLAMIVAAELGAGLRITSGPAIERSGDLAAVLTSLSSGDVLFIDEIHRIAKPAEELLYSAMEDFRVDVIVGKGPGATAIPLDVEPFTLVGATTRSGLLTGPMRDRFGFVGHLDFYAADELEELIHRSAGILGVPVDRRTARPRSPADPAGTPRIANRLLRRVRDFAEVRGRRRRRRGTPRGPRSRCTTSTRSGWTGSTRPCCARWSRRSAAGRSGVSTLAVAVGEQPDTVEEVCEPFLVRAGLLARTPRGRVATAERLAASRAYARQMLLLVAALASAPDLFDRSPSGCRAGDVTPMVVRAVVGRHADDDDRNPTVIYAAFGVAEFDRLDSPRSGLDVHSARHGASRRSTGPFGRQQRVLRGSADRQRRLFLDPADRAVRRPVLLPAAAPDEARQQAAAEAAAGHA